ncbi:MAG: hypothetical protein ACREUW_09685 [Burkholderiales bacterium]
MNKKIAIAAAGGVAVAAALGGGVYYAWQEGLIPASVVRPHPRAPLPENFLATLKASPAVTQSLRPACVRVGLHTGREIDRMGRPGLAYQRVPGWDVLVIAQVPGESGQRIGNLTQALDALAKAGLYAASNTETDDGAGGKLPAKVYALTLAGWTGMTDEQCFKVGTPQVAEITEFARVMPDKDDKRIYEVKARVVTESLAPWVDDPAVQTFTGQEQVKKLREPMTVSYRLLRTADGWEVERPANDIPELSKETALSLVEKMPGGMPQACVRLPVKGSAIDVTLAPYAATLYETGAQGAPDAQFLLQLLWQSRLAQLVKAGLFTEEKVAADPKLNAPAGTRFALDPAYQRWLDLNDAACLRMGEGTLEFVSLSTQSQPPPLRRDGSEPRYAAATAKFLLKLKDAWVEKAGLTLPEVEAVKAAGGVPVMIRFGWVDREKEKGWRLAGVQVPPSDPVPPRMPRGLASRSALTAPAPTPVVPAPGPVVAGSAPAGDITWASGGERTTSGRVSNEGLTVMYCCAGASSTTLATRGVASGKVYAEFTLLARPRALKADTWTTIGVVPAPTPGRDSRTDVAPGTPTMWNQRSNEIAHNDVIGIAVDLDAGQLYFSRNGAWLNGQPGGGGGIPLTRGQTYHIAAVLSSGADSWTANFGKTKFRYPVPRGFRSYDGRQRG